MKKLILTLMIFTSFQSFAGQDGGGGGVIKRDGMYLTFGSAGMKVKLSAALQLEQIPSLNLLLSVLDAQILLPAEFRGQFLQATLPSDLRRYFKIDQSQLNSETYARLIREYSKLWGGQVDPKNLDIAAITVGQDTFLLPPFYHLKAVEQAAILFHESLWIVKPSIAYEDLVSAEITMQSHIEKYGSQSVYNADLMVIFGNALNNTALILAAALIEDLRLGYLVKTVEQKENVQNKKGKFEERIIQVQKYIPWYDYIKDWRASSTAEQKIASLVVGVRRAMVDYPNSLTLKTLYAFRNHISFASFGYYPKNSPSESLIKEVKIPNTASRKDTCMDARAINICFREKY